MSRPAIPARVRLVEVGPRDGLQNEAARVQTSAKVAFIDALTAAGLPVIEVGAFVSPRWVPQMADTDAVCRAITRAPGVVYSALVPNVPGLQRAVACGLQEVAIFAAASESFSKRNINQDVARSLATYREVADAARAADVRVRAYLSTAFGCPFEGAVPVARVVEVARRLRDLGAYEIAVSDTIGVAHPAQVWNVLEAFAASDLPPQDLALHFHDTRGTALANVLAALQAGVSRFDCSAGGLGGCPYAPGAAGNLATEDVVYMLDGLGITTGVQLDRLSAASALMEPLLGHPLLSRYARAFAAAHPET